MPELRTTSSAELRSRIPALERTANSSRTGRAAQQAGSELRRIEKVLQEREAAEVREKEARIVADTAWADVGRLEMELADARTRAREAEHVAEVAYREAAGYSA